MRMVKKKRRHNGHYCKICGCYKSNESFTGKGHARHICKQCQSLPKDEQADMMRCNEVERATFRFPMRRQDWELLEKYAKKYKDRESGQFAQDMLDMKRSVCVPEDDDEETDEWDDNILQVAETPFSELEEDTRTAIEELLEDNINGYMVYKDYIPEGKDLQDIADWVLKETNDTFFLKAVPDDAYRNLVDDTVRKLVKEWQDDGMEIKTYTESLTVMETERLIIRKITRKDMGVLLTLMGKPEVMYAWELGYILDDAYWHNGYATEAAMMCLQYAFAELGMSEVYCSIRPENAPSIHVAEAIGMTPCGSHTITYNGKEMPHVLYKAEKPT